MSDAPARGGGREQGATTEPRAAVLYVVATPIGNLADITLRALEVLRSVPLVAAEDTRLTRRLFARHGIATRLLSYHARNAQQREPELLAHLEGGRDLALVTDAGTPTISDPGEGIVAAWAAEGGRIMAVPGPSAVLAALVTSALPTARWCFEGFLPRRGRQRRDRLARICADPRATVIFEAPTRTAATLRDLAEACGPDRPAALGRELTKLHEETWRGSLLELAEQAGRAEPRGEVTIVVAGRGERSDPVVLDERRLDAARGRVDDLARSGLSRSTAARQVAAESGLPRRELFRSRRG
ncbi:MAG TPA: 16S rRNA (cytidine(1402)-2'-O)-methyltransferase [Candidatus Limnocylindrales bacterium]|nr:16S rRNA (cytidine(1402)-2'-O)-methyltransferase [Candidatus Limnocylindrales bacterium]